MYYLLKANSDLEFYFVSINHKSHFIYACNIDNLFIFYTYFRILDLICINHLRINEKSDLDVIMLICEDSLLGFLR